MSFIHSTSNTTELINFNKNYFKIEADIIKSNTNIDLSYSYTAEKKKRIENQWNKIYNKRFQNCTKDSTILNHGFTTFEGNSAR